MVRKIIPTLILAVVLMKTAMAGDEQQFEKMSVNEAIAYALSTNPELMSLSYEVDFADENLDLAWAEYRPSISATAGVTHQQSNNDVDDEWSSNTSKKIGVEVTQSLFDASALKTIDEQEILKTSAEKVFLSDIHDKILDIVSVYIETYRAEQATKVNEDNVRLLGEQLKATQARFDAGELTKTDVAQAEARLAQAEAELFREKAIYEVSLSNFRRETGYEKDVSLFYPELDVSILPQDLDAAVSQGISSNPDMTAIKADLMAQELNVDAQESRLYPEINLNAGLDVERNPAFSAYDQQETASVDVVATLPLYQSGVLRNQIRQSALRKNQILNDMEATRRRVSNDVIAAWEEYKATLIQLRAREAQLKASKLAYQGVQLEEEVGARSVLDVLDANQDVRDAELLLIDTKSDMVNAYYQLLGSIGILDDSLWDKSKRML